MRDAFDTEVNVGDTVAFYRKQMRKGVVTKVTPKGATVRCGIRKVNVRSKGFCVVTQVTGGVVAGPQVIDMTHEDYLEDSPSLQPVMCEVHHE